MARGLLPAEVIDAPKQGFASPVPHWLKSGLAAPARRLLTRPESLERGWWSAEGVEKLLADPDRHGFRVYSLMMLELAVRLYGEGEPDYAPPSTTLAEFVE
jgi:asparagine synthase (glutamine-hydrolysing)